MLLVPWCLPPGNGAAARPASALSSAANNKQRPLVVADRAVVARALDRRGRVGGGGGVAGGELTRDGVVAVHVAVDAPAHVERGGLVHLIHVLHLPVARLAGDAGVHVAH